MDRKHHKTHHTHDHHVDVQKLQQPDSSQKQDLTDEVTQNPISGGRRMYTDWDGLPGSEHIHKLTDDNLTAFLKSREAVLVMFYAPCTYYVNRLSWRII
jgi:hypothetical protein